MLTFQEFIQREGLGRGQARSQIMVIKLNIKEMHFKNVHHWEHAFCKKILNTFSRLHFIQRLYLTSSSIPISVCDAELQLSSTL